MLVGATVDEPDAPGEDTSVKEYVDPFVELHVRVALDGDPPIIIVVGFTETVADGEGAASTVTVAVAEFVPP